MHGLTTKVLLAAAMLGIGAPAAQAEAAESTTALRVDVSKPMGRIKPLRGVNGAPDLTFLPKEAHSPQMGPPQDLSASYRSAHVNLVRTHDTQGVGNLDPAGVNPAAPRNPGGGFSPELRRAMDRNVIFPDSAADPDDPRSYNFGPADRLVKSIRALGAEVIFRIGRDGMGGTPPPTDLKKYESIIRHIVLHYNKGWANGFQDSVRYWEVWNEPDLGSIWWQGTPQQYYDFYATAARAVKAADPASAIGGPSIALVNEATPYREGFLAFVKANSLPLDFFSWHWYSTDADDPYDFNIIGARMRVLLDSYGFTKTQSFLDEWNADYMQVRTTPPMRLAAYLTSARIYMQDAPIDLDAYYRADTQFGEMPTKTGHALIASGRMADTPVRLATSGADTNGLAVLAGRSEDGKTIQVLVSNYEIAEDKRAPRAGPDLLSVPNLFNLKLLPRRAVSYPARGRYTLALAGLPRGAWQLEHFRIDESQDLALVARRAVAGGAPVISSDLAAPMIDLFVLRRSARGRAPKG